MVAVDLGATSGRFAVVDSAADRLAFRVVEQVPHTPRLVGGRLTWDLDVLLNLCRSALAYAEAHYETASLGIDSWGVDHGFLDADGHLIQPVVSYRDPVHADVYERHADLRNELYQLTGAQHQPFNTIYQLIARREADPTLPHRAQWLMFPELLHHLLGVPAGHEVTQCSTTQLVGLDGQWSPRAFEIAGWPVPNTLPGPTGTILGQLGSVRIVRVGGHDSASAVAGLGSLPDDAAFLNVGTWTLLGTLLDAPLANPATAALNLTNERTVDGRVRLLKNIPGFWVINRLHEELQPGVDIPTWLATAPWADAEAVSLDDDAFFNPPSMRALLRERLPRDPANTQAWAGIALRSMVQSTVDALDGLADLTGRTFRTIRVAGGGSRSAAFNQALAHLSRRRVVAGPDEATVLGNLAVQAQAMGHVADADARDAWVAESLDLIEYPAP